MNSPAIFYFGNQNHMKSGWMHYSKSEKNITHGDIMLSKDFKEFIELLNKNSVKYLMVGEWIAHRIWLMQKI